MRVWFWLSLAFCFGVFVFGAVSLILSGGGH